MTKLFLLVQPDLAFFGEKDFQQLAIIRRLVRDLDFPIEIVGVPTVRESDGLAMSSRNTYLTAEQRQHAPGIYQALTRIAQETADRAHASVEEAKAAVVYAISQLPEARIDYIELVRADSLEPATSLDESPLRWVAAVFFGKTRLIDNVGV